jgi:PAS domain S-box-containing protein
MLRKTDTYKRVILYSSGFALAGFLALVIAVTFAFIPAGLPFTADSVNLLYQVHNEFYLLNLLPVLMAVAGGFAGREISIRKENENKKVKSYEEILKRTVEFVQRIERNDLNTPFIALNGETLLANAMESMRESLISASLREHERNEINTISNEVNALLQSCSSIDRLSGEIVTFLVNKLDNVVQGAFYIVEDEDDGEPVLRMKASYAYNRKKYLHAEFKFAQGLVGQAAAEKDHVLRTEIPDDYLTLSSGLLGEKKPDSILINPFISNDTVHGAIELASINRFTPHQLEIIRELCTIIARAIANLKNSNRTLELLAESERMSNELREQKKQLTKNAEDLLKTQEELKNANVKLEEQMQEAYNSSKRSHVLLENAKEVITIISEDRKILYVSPSIKSIMGYYPEELLGKNSTENVHPLDTEKFRHLLSDLKSYPEKERALQLRYFTKEGEVMWVEAIGKNLLSDDVINGFVINSRDISEQRIAAKEQRIRAKMQALSENSSDIIIRIDIFSRCTYINPVIEQYTGFKKDSYLNKPISNTEMDPAVVTVLKRLLEEVSKSKVEKTEEMVFPSPGGTRTMHVNAIPEFNDNGEAESVLFAFHDITEAKAREEVIRKKNKSISDSINYALNIQSALMPTEENLRKLLPNSFMFYEPKDVVSGDYPWIFKTEESIFIGAMDCTGHGVPGALMSIIGFFLQDAIISHDTSFTAGDVLNKLHVSVVERLKQSEPGSKINDGMDAAFCKINIRKRELDFAGAHRPLYYVTRNNMTEIKGDKFPVGSTQYRNRKDFTNHKIKIKSGDAVYFMTDGFPDQSGGPTGKQRFTSDRVGQLIQENTHLSIFQMGNLFRKTYLEWKGNANQVDDILVIGIKFK